MKAPEKLRLLTQVMHDLSLAMSAGNNEKIKDILTAVHTFSIGQCEANGRGEFSAEERRDKEYWSWVGLESKQKAGYKK